MLCWTLIFLIACLGLMEASLLLWLVSGMGEHCWCRPRDPSLVLTALLREAAFHAKAEMPASCLSSFSRS